MAPPRKVITSLGQCLRAAREAVGLDQVGLGKRVFISARQVSRWENGRGRPDARSAALLLDVLSAAPAPVLEALAEVLGVELPEEDDSVTQVVLPAPLPQAPPPPPRPTATDLRAALDAVIFGAAESRDVLPRHLRAFAVELLERVDRLGMSAKEAALVVAAQERTPADKT
jgi:transcriptional regulator with XRE-family HTH domain